ncbi:MAG: biopolymer transporter ExbD [Thermoguttaceae bacterium]|nr:biopolymer transporter ExbD [Thermoguttaceae bacterium]
MARKTRETEKLNINMTPMIDIVFQLLIFFVMSFKIVTPEGDFSVKMPMAPAEGKFDPESTPPLPPIAIRLNASMNGQLLEVQCGSHNLGRGEAGLVNLRKFILQQVAPKGGRPNPEVARETEIELTCDFRLKYEYVIKCISYVTGYREGNDVVRIAEKIKFAAPVGN